MLGEERFATHVAHVNIILEIPKITKVPRTPDYMKGVINHRGIVLPVFDLRLKMSMEEKEYTMNSCILVLEIDLEQEKVHVGTIVDSVREVLEIKDENIQPPPTMGINDNEKYIYGVAKINDEFILMLDMNKVLSNIETIEISKQIQKIEAKDRIEEDKTKKTKAKKEAKELQEK
jgi:purine-binding chemotaxis protein CheW